MKRHVHTAIPRADQTQLSGGGFGGRDPTPSPCPITRTSGPADLQQNGGTAKPKHQQKRFAHIDLNTIAIWLFFIAVAIISLLTAVQLWAKLHPH